MIMDKISKENPFTRRRPKMKMRTESVIVIIRESLKAVFKQYCEESSICGLKHLVNDKTSFIERVIWIITLMMAVVCSVLLVRMTFQDYYKAPLVTTQLPEGVSVSKIVFPAVGICPYNRISKQAVTELAHELLKEERNKKYNESEMLLLLFGLRQLYDMQPMDHRHVQPMELHQALGEYNVKEVLKKLTPRCEDILLQCAWNSVSKNCSSLFDFRLTANGYCCTFNYLRQSDYFETTNSETRNIDMHNFGNKSTFDYDQGLKFLLRINENDDFYYSIPVQGARLQFSDAYDFPDEPSGSFAMQTIKINTQMTVLISASFTEASRDIQHVAVKLRGCLFYDESSYLPFYTSSDCNLKCRMLFLLDKCNCTPFNMPKMKDTRTCDMRDVSCLRHYYVQSINVRPNVENAPEDLELDLVDGGIPCPMCYPTCSKTAYKYDFINVHIFPDQLDTVPDCDRIEWLRGANFTGTSIVHIKYAREIADCYGQNVIMKWFDLISDIGSTCGFVTGFSFVSVLEFFYFFTVKLYRELSLRRQQQSQVVAVAPAEHPVQTHLPITRYRPIYWNELAGSIPKGRNGLYI